MAIQFGSTAINAIKYRNASGVLQDVTSVVRNGVDVWTRTRTDNNGVWSEYYDGEPIWIYHWEAAFNAFLLEDGNYAEAVWLYDGEKWSNRHVENGAITSEICSANGDRYSTELESTDGTTVKWTSEERQITAYSGDWWYFDAHWAWNQELGLFQDSSYGSTLGFYETEWRETFSDGTVNVYRGDKYSRYLVYPGNDALIFYSPVS